MTIHYAHLTWEPDNILTANSSTFETSVGNWGTLVNCTLLLNAGSTPSFVQTEHAKLTSSAGGPMSTTTPSGTAGYPCAPGVVVSALAHCRTASAAQSCSLDIIFYDANGAVISTDVGSTVTDATGIWKRVTNSGTSPAGTAFVALKYLVANTGGASEIHHIDGVMLWVGAAATSEFAYCAGDTSASKITCPDSTQLSPTGDLDLIVHCALDDFSPAGAQALLSKWITTGNQRSFRFSLATDGKLILEWSADGTTVITKTSTVVAPTNSGDPVWLRVTLDVNNGAAGNDVKFYTSPDGVTYTQVGSTVTTASTTSVFNSTSQIEIGAANSSADRELDFRVYHVQMFGSINGTSQIAGWDFTEKTIGATTVTDAFGNVATLAGNSYLDEWEVGSGDTFAAYLIERSDDASGFLEIARITSMLVQQFNDYEGKRNVTATYRMRTERDDGSLSAYTPTGTALPTFTQCGYQFTSNEDPTKNLEYTDEPDRVYEFEDKPQEWDLYSRDYSVVFRGTENRGDTFTANLWLYMGGTPGTNAVPSNLRGRPAFQPLIDLVRAQLSYVCVLDQDGSRWFAALTMSKGTRQEPGGKYLFPVRVRQVTATPSTPDATP